MRNKVILYRESTNWNKYFPCIDPTPSLAIGKTTDDEEVGTIFPKK